MKRHLIGCIAAAAIAASAVPANAFTAAAPAVKAGISSELLPGVTFAKHRKKKRVKWLYHRKYHGHRKRHRDHIFRFHLGGYYYPYPFWQNIYDDGYWYYADDFDYGSDYKAHVWWCLNRYRSYDIRSDTFMGYDGRRHRCNSPYD